MVPVTTNVEEMLKRFSGVLPVEKLSNPTLFAELIGAMLPVLSFDPAPLVSPLLRTEMFSAAITIGVGHSSVSFQSDTVPPLEIHRYSTIALGHSDVAARVFLLKELYLDGTGTPLASSTIVEMNIPASTISLPTNMLASLFDSGTKPRNFNGRSFDLYPGGLWQINNVPALPGSTDLICTGFRRVFRGPALAVPADVSDDIVSSSF